jgi:hypothetical protein
MSSQAPLVSVCVPNLNTRPYLQERVDTIFAQTLPELGDGGQR